jgi:hypothetical protein
VRTRRTHLEPHADRGGASTSTGAQRMRSPANNDKCALHKGRASVWRCCWQASGLEQTKKGRRRTPAALHVCDDIVDTCEESAARLVRRERQVRLECICDFNKKLCGPRRENIGQAKVGALFVGQKSRFEEVFSRQSTSYCNSYIIRLILPDGPSFKWSLAKATPVQIPQSLTLICPWHERFVLAVTDETTSFVCAATHDLTTAWP